VKIKDVINEAGFLNKLGAGIRGAVAGVQASQARRAADPDAAVRNRIRQQNFKQELTQWKQNLAMLKQRGVNVNDPQIFLNTLNDYVNIQYPASINKIDINTVKPSDPKSIFNYLFAAYGAQMDAPLPPSPAKSTTGSQSASSELKDWIPTTLGIQIRPATSNSLTLAKQGKKYYALDDNDQWLTSNDRPVGMAMSSLLNQALDQTRGDS
jgi:hypothetical protein